MSGSLFEPSRSTEAKPEVGTSIASVLPLAFFNICGFVWGLACRAVPAGWKWCSLLRPMDVISPCPCPLAVGMGAPVSPAWVSPGWCLGFHWRGWGCLMVEFCCWFVFWVFYLTFCCQNTAFLTKKMQMLGTWGPALDLWWCWLECSTSRGFVALHS